MSNQTTPFPDEAFWADAYRIALTQGKNFRDAAAIADETIKALRERRQPITAQHRDWMLNHAKECYENRREIAKEPRPGLFGGLNPWDWAEPTMEAMRDYDREVARINLIPVREPEPSLEEMKMPCPIDELIEALNRLQGQNVCSVFGDVTVQRLINLANTQPEPKP